MKRSVKLIIMLSALAVACLGYFAAVKLSEREAAKQTVNEVKLVNADVVGFNWTNGGESLALENVDGVWMLKGDDKCPVDQEMAAEMAGAVANYTAQATITGDIALSDYGLDAPSREVTVATGEGDIVFKQGDVNPLTSQVYIQKSTDEGQIYAADESLDDLFSISAIDLVKLEEIPTIGDAKTLTIAGRVEIARDENGEWHTSTDEVCDEVKVEALFDAIREINWKSVVDWTGETAPENPVSIMCTWPSGEYEVIIAGQPSPSHLAKLPNSNLTYTIDSANAEVILNASNEALTSAPAHKEPDPSPSSM